MSLLGISTAGHWGGSGEVVINQYNCPIKGVITETNLKGNILQDSITGTINIINLKGVISD